MEEPVLPPKPPIPPSPAVPADGPGNNKKRKLDSLGTEDDAHQRIFEQFKWESSTDEEPADKDQLKPHGRPYRIRFPQILPRSDLPTTVAPLVAAEATAATMTAMSTTATSTTPTAVTAVTGGQVSELLSEERAVLAAIAPEKFISGLGHVHRWDHLKRLDSGIIVGSWVL